MDQKQLIGQRIRERRKLKGWRLEQLGEPTRMNISTLSKIETGDASYNASEDALNRIAEALDTTLDNLRFGSGNYKVGVGACLWAAPLLHMINEEKVPHKFSIAYQTDGAPVYHDNVTNVEPSKNKSATNKKVKLYTARELIELLLSKDMDLIFVPRGTYDTVPDTFRICSIMNTVRGGLNILVNNKASKKDEDVIKDFQEKTKPGILFHSTGTIAEAVANKIFLTNELSKIEIEKIEINDLDNFQTEFLKELKNNEKKKYTYIGYIGWEPHISILKKKLKESEYPHINVIGISDIIERSQPFQHINFDCIINADKVDIFKQSNDLIDFFSALDRSLNELNKNISYTKVHRSIQEIANNLSMEGEDALKSLSEINFELTFSKEWELYKTKS